MNSTTVPVTVCPAVPKNAFVIRARSVAATPIYCWPYTGATPASVPATCAAGGSAATGCYELSAGVAIADDMNFSANATFQLSPFSEGWACTLSGGSTAVLTDCIYR